MANTRRNWHEFSNMLIYSVPVFISCIVIIANYDYTVGQFGILGFLFVVLFVAFTTIALLLQLEPVIDGLAESADRCGRRVMSILKSIYRLSLRMLAAVLFVCIICGLLGLDHQAEKYTFVVVGILLTAHHIHRIILPQKKEERL